jgi:hypothetical protein
MKWLISTALLMMALSTVSAQQDTTRVLAITPSVWFEPRVKERLAKDWTDAPNQLERAYCARVAISQNWRYGGPEYVVIDVWEALTSGQSQSGITNIICDGHDDVILVHTHTPTTRPSDWDDRGDSTYVYGGRAAFECWPSTTDMTTLYNSNRPFDLVQCEKNAIVPYFRNPYRIFKPVVVHVPYFVYDTVHLTRPKKKPWWKRVF